MNKTMTIYDAEKVCSLVVLKGQNHRGERCFYLYLGDKIFDAIEGATGILETLKLQGEKLVRVPFLFPNQQTA